MKKILISISALLLSLSTFAQTPVLEIQLPATSRQLNLVLQNPALTPTYTWTEVGASGFLQTDLTTLTTGSSTISMIPSVADGNSANISVVANNAGCSSDPFTFTLKAVSIPSFTITAAAVAGVVCQGGTGSVNITFNTSVTKFAYWIDADNSGAMDNGEAIQSQNVGAATYALTTAALNTPGTVTLHIVSISGVNAGVNTNSPSTTTAAITVNEKPVIIDIQ